MSNTGIKLTDYVKAGCRLICIRSAVNRDWNDSPKFTLDEAEDVANYILSEVEKARRSHPDVKAFVDDIHMSYTVGDSYNWEDLAYQLYKKGYRKVV